MAGRILVVEPEREVRDLVVAGLAGQGHDVLSASSGAECLAIAQSQRPELISTEVSLPGMDGFETVRRLQDDPSTRPIPVIFLTSCTSLRDRVEGLRLGAHAYLTKPFAFPELYATVEGILRRAQTSREPTSSTSVGLMGSLGAIGIAGVIQAIEAEGQTGVLSVVSGTKWGRVCFVKGKIMEAVTGSAGGEEAIYDMVPWNSGTYTFRAHAVEATHPPLAESATSLLMRAYQRFDERTPGAPRRAPGPHAREAV